MDKKFSHSPQDRLARKPRSDACRNVRSADASEYVRELIRRAQKEHSDEELERLILDGLKSGEPIPVTPEYWEKKRARLASRAKTPETGE